MQLQWRIGQLCISCDRFFAPDDRERRVRRLEGEIAKLDRRQPERVTGRHMCFGRMAAASARQVEKSEAVAAAQEAMQGHAQAYDDLDVGQRRVFDAMARRSKKESYI